MEESSEALARGAELLDVSLTPGTVQQFQALLQLLCAANAATNLTSVREPGEITRRHFLEPVALGARLDRYGLLAPRSHVLDLGSGAGFPGLPLKLAWPEIELTFLEATGKKARFIRFAIAALNLAATRVLTGRAETLAHDPALRAQFDLVVARAVASLPVLVELSLPLLRLGGTLAALKGSRTRDELEDAAAALQLCGGVIVDVEPLMEGRLLQVVRIQKLSPTPDKYPRRPGQPASHPLM